uniref:Uncharacterized protein n=1 Tax=Timema bartmani TaxID=61472 RepID=A0A7R9FDP9_9NEOP|nr:unnamed protein product [Timema bartmani]
MCLLCRELESITSIPMLIEVVFSLVIFCTCGFQLTLAESGQSKAIIIIAFIFFAIPFFVFCKLSTDLALQSAAVAEAAYNMEWYDAPPTFKSSVCVIIARSQRPVALTAGKFNPVTLNTFISVF